MYVLTFICTSIVANDMFAKVSGAFKQLESIHHHATKDEGMHFLHNTSEDHEGDGGVDSHQHVGPNHRLSSTTGNMGLHRRTKSNEGGCELQSIASSVAGHPNTRVASPPSTEGIPSLNHRRASTTSPESVGTFFRGSVKLKLVRKGSDPENPSPITSPGSDTSTTPISPPPPPPPPSLLTALTSTSSSSGSDVAGGVNKKRRFSGDKEKSTTDTSPRVRGDSDDGVGSPRPQPVHQGRFNRDASIAAASPH